VAVLYKKNPKAWEEKLSFDDLLTLATLRSIEKSVGVKHCDKCDMPLPSGTKIRCESCRGMFGTYGINV
jgi:hypothetical protein